MGNASFFIVLPFSGEFCRPRCGHEIVAAVESRRGLPLASAQLLFSFSALQGTEKR